MGLLTKFFIIFLILGMAGGGAYAVYFFVYKNQPSPEPEEIISHNLFLRITDKVTNDQIITGFLIYFPDANEVFMEDRTLKEGRLKVAIPANTSFYLLNKNLDNQEYYTALWRNEKQVLSEDQSASLKLELPGKISISHVGEFGEDPNLTLSLLREGTIKNVKTCVRWTSRVVAVHLPDLNLTDVPTRLYNKVDRCYESTEISQNSSSPTLLNISYESFGNLRETDFIKLYFIDQDVRYWSLTQENPLISEDQEGEDIGKRDIIYLIRRL